MTSERFQIEEQPMCMCGMRVFHVADNREGGFVRAHAGNLNPHDAAHRAVRDLLKSERP